MNSHQRRKASRRAHMLLPLGKSVTIGPLIGRLVWNWHPLHASTRLTREQLAGVVDARVSRHVFAKNKAGSGEHSAVCIDLIHADGREAYIKTTMRGLKLVNKADRAPRPWWAENRRRQRGL